jgi:hypothetical protein
LKMKLPQGTPLCDSFDGPRTAQDDDPRNEGQGQHF